MKNERFSLRTDSSWKNYGIFLVTCTVIVVPIALFAPPRLENLAIVLGGLALFAVVSTPLLFIASSAAGNWIELRPDRLHVRRWWINNLDVAYADITELRESSRHNPVTSYVWLRGAPFEEHVDFKIKYEGVRRMWGLRGWISADGWIHFSPANPDSFVQALRPRLTTLLS